MSETVGQGFERAAASRSGEPALRFKRDGEWQVISWGGYRELVHRAARGFIALGLQPGQAVTIAGFNRPEWFVADLAAILAGGVPAGIYTSLTPEQCGYIAGHAGAAVSVVEDREQLDKMLAVREGLPALERLVLVDGDGDGDGDGVIGWDELLALGDEVDPAELERRMAAQRPEDLATLIYTSGTTGPPKAVMLSHRNITWTADALIGYLGIGAGEQFLSYLPLSHIAEQMVSLHAPIRVGACTAFAESLENLPRNLTEVRPTVFFAVPRVWEKVQAAISAAGAQAPPLRRRIAAWARRQGLAGGYAHQSGRRPPLGYGLARRLVFSKVRRKLGLDRARICACSAAPVTLDTLEFFLSLGIPIFEIYGMSEVTGPGTLCGPDRYRTGRAGFAIPGTELEIAADGEILMRGPHVFLGYYKDPEATAETLDADGWVHSGDIGELDADGFLKVTDRKKELIITSGGKNIAPAPIEARLRSIPAVAQAVVIGDGHNYLTALLTLDAERLPAEAEAAGSSAGDLEAAAVCPEIRDRIERQVEEVNRELAGVETIKRFSILPGELSIEGGELTPTMKIKRRVVQEKYAPQIEALYT